MTTSLSSSAKFSAKLYPILPQPIIIIFIDFSLRGFPAESAGGRHGRITPAFAFAPFPTVHGLKHEQDLRDNLPSGAAQNAGEPVVRRGAAESRAANRRKGRIAFDL
jgi:hypothetical protein